MRVFCKHISRIVFNNLKKVSVIKSETMPFYAVAKGKVTGIFMTWGDCEAQVKGFSGARYKKFDSINDAQNFVLNEGGNSQTNAPGLKKTTQNNLKRSYSTSTAHQKDTTINKKINKKPNETVDFEDDEDLNTIVMKQMDDIEKRLKSFEKGVDKIIKKNIKEPRKTILIEPPKPKKQRKTSSIEFEIDNDGYVEVYTDGACSSNGKNGARAGFGVYWGDDHPLNTSKPVSGRATNNCGEIQAATYAIKLAIDNDIKKLAINTDSKFLINSVTKWIPGWKRKGWKLQSGDPVKNQKDFMELDDIQNKVDIKWNYVEAHKGIHGNEMADQLAKAGAAMYNK